MIKTKFLILPLFLFAMIGGCYAHTCDVACSANIRGSMNIQEFVCTKNGIANCFKCNKDNNKWENTTGCSLRVFESAASDYKKLGWWNKDTKLVAYTNEDPVEGSRNVYPLKFDWIVALCADGFKPKYNGRSFEKCIPNDESKFCEWDGKYYSPGDVISTFNCSEAHHEDNKTGKTCMYQCLTKRSDGKNTVFEMVKTCPDGKKPVDLNKADFKQTPNGYYACEEDLTNKCKHEGHIYNVGAIIKTYDCSEAEIESKRTGKTCVLVCLKEKNGNEVKGYEAIKECPENTTPVKATKEFTTPVTDYYSRCNPKSEPEAKPENSTDKCEHDGQEYNIGAVIKTFDCSTAQLDDNKTGKTCVQLCLKEKNSNEVNGYEVIQECPENTTPVKITKEFTTPVANYYSRCDQKSEPEAKPEDPCDKYKEHEKRHACCLAGDTVKWSDENNLDNGECICLDEKKQNEDPLKKWNGEKCINVDKCDKYKQNKEAHTCCKADDATWDEKIPECRCQKQNTEWKFDSKQNIGKCEKIIDPKQKEIDDAKKVLSEFFNWADKDSNKSVWKDSEGNFNTTRLVSDLTAGVVLGTVGGVVSGVVIKKKQLQKGFDVLHCTVGGQTVANWGDEFWVGITK